MAFNIIRIRRPLFWKLSISYALVLIVPLLIGSFAYNAVVRTFKNDAMQNNLLLLEQTKEIMDARLREIEAIGRQISRGPKMNSLINGGMIEEGSPKYYHVWEAVNYSPQFTAVNTFIANYYVFFRSNSFVLSSNTAFPDMDRFWMSLFEKDASLDQQQFLRMLWGQFHQSTFLPGGQVTLDKKQHQVLYYLRSFPFDSIGNPLGVVMVLVDQEKIDQLLARLKIGDSGLVYISDEEGRVITSITAGQTRVAPEELSTSSFEGGFYRSSSEEELYVSRTVSDLNGWSYVSAVPADMVLSKVQYIKNFTVVAVLLTIMVGIVLALFLGYRNSKPIKQLLQQLPDWFGSEEKRYANEYDYLNDSISRLIENHHLLHEKVEEQIPLLRQAFFRRLLYGEFVDDKEIEIFQRRVGLEMSARNFFVLLLRVDETEAMSADPPLEEIRMLNIVIKNAIDRSMSHLTYYSYDIDENKFALIIGFNDEGQERQDGHEEAQSIIESLSLSLDNRSRMRLSFAAGTAYKGIKDICVSYFEAKQALEYTSSKDLGQRFARYEDIPKESDKYYYPIDLELRLINSIKSGNRTDVEHVLALLYTENFEKRNLTVPNAEQLLYLMVGSVSRGLDQTKDTAIGELTIGELQRKDSIEELFQRIGEAYLDCCEVVHVKNQSAKTELRDQVENFIHQNYMRDDITLFMVAEEFRTTEATMYQFIKDHLGMTFSDYVESLRIQRACELFQGQQAQVKDVALMIGYCSDRTFRRAFKRVMGVPPTTYLKF